MKELDCKICNHFLKTSIMSQVCEMVDSLSLRMADSILCAIDGNYFGSEVIAVEVHEQLKDDLDFFGKSSFYYLYKWIVEKKAIEIAYSERE